MKIDLRGINVVRRAIKKFDRSEQNAVEVRKRIYKLYKSNDMYVLEKLKALDEGNSLVKKYIADYELSLSIWSGHEEKDDLKREEGLVNEENVTLNVEDIVTLGFQIERNNIQTMYENGRISWETAQRMRENISLMEIQLARNN
ncbi:hypothetical protein [Konateibacter massiliensis]|uniref:hypothetical protein n=1 Tax=Konateibacter massiliensis TaxID=2002841 RepID=UPI000C14A8A2|nr:hypothetical protein [Konateibacter massiliensis]